MLGIESDRVELIRNSPGKITQMKYTGSDTRIMSIDYKFQNDRLIWVRELTREGNTFVLSKKIQNFYPFEIRTDVYGRDIEIYIYEGGTNFYYDDYGRFTRYENGGLGYRQSFQIKFEDGLMTQTVRKSWSEINQDPNLQTEITKIEYKYRNKTHRLAK